MKNSTQQPLQIVVTNDDGVQAPGIWAASVALSELGEVTISAPRAQASGSGRSFPFYNDGKISVQTVELHGRTWQAHAVGGTPAQAVFHAVQDILGRKPDLVVSGINFGENLGDSLGSSGTIGGALEAAGLGIPALAVSLQLKNHRLEMRHPSEADFAAAAYFTRFFASLVLQKPLPHDVDVLKIDVPYDATPQTPWRITRSAARFRYYSVRSDERQSWDEPAKYDIIRNDRTREGLPPDSDVAAVAFDHVVAVTPLSIDMSSRIQLDDLSHELKSREQL